MPEYFYLDSNTAQLVTADRQTVKQIANGGNSTIYYGTSQSVSASSNDGSIASKASISINKPTWLVAATQSHVIVVDAEEFDFHASEAFTSHSGGITVNPTRSVARLDEAGNFFLGPNELLYGTTQQSFNYSDWTEGRSAPDFAYIQNTRRIYLRSALLTEVGDVPDLTLGRFGTNNTYPLGPTQTAAGLTGVEAGTAVGKLGFRGAMTPAGGTPEVTAGATLSGRIAAVYARTAETLTTTAQGGHLIFQTIPTGSTTLTDRARFNADGKFELGANFDTNIYSVSADTLKTDDSFEVAGANGVFVSNASASPAIKANIVAGGTLLQNKLLAGDANPAFQVLGDGRVVWGAGGASGVDVQISRTDVSELTLAAGDKFRLGDGSFLHWGHANNEQTTVGAAGAASAVPATPTKYLKVKDKDGTTLVVPAFAAS